MLKIVSENFIHALLLFLGLFLKISRWVPPMIYGTGMQVFVVVQFIVGLNFIFFCYCVW